MTERYATMSDSDSAIAWCGVIFAIIGAFYLWSWGCPFILACALGVIIFMITIGVLLEIRGD